MPQEFMLQAVREALMMVLIISGPPVGLSLVVGLMVSLFQATTQIQEQTLTFVPKMLTVMGLLGLLGYWMMAQMIRFATHLYEAFPRVVA